MAVRLLDTNIVSYCFKGHTLAAVYRPFLLGHTLAICFMNQLRFGGTTTFCSRRRFAHLRLILWYTPHPRPENVPCRNPSIRRVLI